MGAATSFPSSASSSSSLPPPSHRFASVVTSASHLPPATRPPVVSGFFSFRLASAPSFFQDSGLAPFLPKVFSLFSTSNPSPASASPAPCGVATLSARLRSRKNRTAHGGILVASFSRIEVLSAVFGCSLYELAFPREWGGCACGALNEDASLGGARGVVFLAFRDGKIRCFSPENVAFLGELALPFAAHDQARGDAQAGDCEQEGTENRRRTDQDESGRIRLQGNRHLSRKETADAHKHSIQPFPSSASAPAFPTVLTCPMNNSVICGDASGAVCAFFLETRQIAATYNVPECILDRQKALRARWRRKDRQVCNPCSEARRQETEKRRGERSEAREKENVDGSPSSSFASSSVNGVSPFCGDAQDSRGLLSVSTLHCEKRLLFVAYGPPSSAALPSPSTRESEGMRDRVEAGKSSACTENEDFSRVHPAEVLAAASPASGASGASPGPWETPASLSPSAFSSPNGDPRRCVSALSPVSGRSREAEFERRPPSLHDFSSFSSPARASDASRNAGEGEQGDSGETPEKGVSVHCGAALSEEGRKHSLSDRPADAREGGAPRDDSDISGVDIRSSLFPLLVFALETGKCLGCLWGAQSPVVALHVGTEWGGDRERGDSLREGRGEAVDARSRGGNGRDAREASNGLWCVAVTEREILVWKQGEKAPTPRHRHLRGDAAECPSFFCGFDAASVNSVCRAEGETLATKSADRGREEENVNPGPDSPRPPDNRGSHSCHLFDCETPSMRSPSWSSPSCSSCAASPAVSGALSRTEGGVVDGVVWRLVSRVSLTAGVHAFASSGGFSGNKETEGENARAKGTSVSAQARAVGAALDPEERVILAAMDPGENSELWPCCIFWKIRRETGAPQAESGPEHIEIRPWRQLTLRAEPSTGPLERRLSSPSRKISSFWYQRAHCSQLLDAFQTTNLNR
ncbi:conserved hypothetical protein [Neospora caninum Liverpool]|uniref:Uncharacterized protein n=1 Tax=Neospora caninum (strain Liverpool) TaxID=572307 RepID=F0VAV5_NEOCL|nr:conserved hypothetical protein [Neospora caninum Liverpool]CBZ50813.1 conserved hypothetical protein [Neospora caninum Liverpool]|eukprot:XP_003880846.1 conserved hypothetical protein [Neospora caninum Liverpool]